MADVKISALPAATTPLGGTEVLPIVQSGTTKKVSIADVTAGRAMSASSLTLSSPLGVASGGTGLNSLTAGRIPYGDGTGAFGNSANLTFINNALSLNAGGNGNIVASVATSTAYNMLTLNGTSTFAGGAGMLGQSGDNILYFVSPSFGGFQWRINNNTQMYMDASGNLGIGTSSPGAKLDVVSADDVPMYFRNTSGVFRIRPYVTSYASAQLASLNAGLSAYAPLAVGGSITTLETNGIEHLRIDSSGNVGIGTSSPSYKLDVSGNSIVGRFNGSATAFFDLAVGGTTNGRFGTNGFATNDFFCGTTGATPLVFVTNNAGRARIDSSGNLLIGTTTTRTNTKLVVNGGSYAEPSLASGGVQISSRFGPFNDNNSNSSTGDTINSCAGCVYITSSAGMTSIPFFSNGGASIGWRWTYLDPDAGTWAYSPAGNSVITFTQAGTGGNTFTVTFDYNNGAVSVQRTAGSLEYSFYIQKFAAG